MIKIKGKNYCVSECFKNKLWHTKNLLVEFFVGAFMVTAFSIAAILVLSIIGFLAQPLEILLFGFIVTFDKPLPIAGLAWLFIAVITVVVLIIIYKILHIIGSAAISLSKAISGNTKYMLNIPNSEFTCTILEECTTDLQRKHYDK